MTNDVIATDHPLNAAQQQTLAALLDTLLPASDDGNMPSAQTLDLVGYLNEKAEDFIPLLITLIDHLDDGFADGELSERYTVIEAFSKDQPELFEGLLFHAYTCYYQDDRVLEGIGMNAGPPFPTGNTIEEGDLSLLDPVVQVERTYRK
jgi:hypothetical protein